MMNYDELVQMHQNGEINTVQFIEKQPEIRDEFERWREEIGAGKNEDTANQFLQYKEEMIMNTQQIRE